MVALAACYVHRLGHIGELLCAVLIVLPGDIELRLAEVACRGTYQRIILIGYLYAAARSIVAALIGTHQHAPQRSRTCCSPERRAMLFFSLWIFPCGVFGAYMLRTRKRQVVRYRLLLPPTLFLRAVLVIWEQRHCLPDAYVSAVRRAACIVVLLYHFPFPAL